MNWDDARYFLAVARAGQMLGAAHRLGVSQALLSRRLAALEEATGTRLMDRSPKGCTLTPAGEEMFAAAERAEAAMLGVEARIGGGEATVTGTVRIGAPDGFGAVFLAPRLGRLREAHPDLTIQLVPITRSFSLPQREADLAIMVGRPDKGRLRIRKLTDYTIGLYASGDYLEREGTPNTPADLEGHTKVGYVEDLVPTPELHYASEFLRDWRSDIEVASATGQLEAVRAGAGIGPLHDFMTVGQTDLQRVLPDVTVSRSYWTVWHEAMRGTRRVEVVVEFLDRIVREDRALFMTQGR